MNAALRPTITLREFLAWEEQQELRYEFDGHRAIAMVGGTEAHELIAANIIFELKLRLRGGPCRAYGGGMKIEVAGRIRYPDAPVVCSSVQADRKLVLDPVVVFVKNDEYRATPSISRYVMLSQRSIAATIFTRMDEAWAGSLVTDPAAILAMPEIGIEVPLLALYDGLEFDGKGEKND